MNLNDFAHVITGLFIGLFFGFCLGVSYAYNNAANYIKQQRTKASDKFFEE